jgi:tripartite-type tricarboxylate transporter receptor subunit TctC
VTILAAFAAALLWQTPAPAQDQPIKIVFPFAAGGSGDALTRMIADGMHQSLGRAVIVENRTGAAGRIGTVAVKNAAPDGNTLLITPIAPVAVYQHVYPNLGYDPINDFAPISQLTTFDFAVAVGAQVPAKTLKELVAWVKADPARATFASPAAGALPHFFGVLFGSAAGLELRHAPYRGSAAALPDLIAGHVPMMFTTLSDLLENHRAGRIRILATSGNARSPFAEGSRPSARRVTTSRAAPGTGRSRRRARRRASSNATARSCRARSASQPSKRSCSSSDCSRPAPRPPNLPRSRRRIRRVGSRR